MALVVLTVVVVGLMITVLAIYLFMIGVLLNRTAGNLGDCLQSVRTVAGQADVIGPSVKRLNKTGGELLGALPLLVEGADGVGAKLAPASTAPAAAGDSPAAASAASTNSSTAARARVGYLDPAPATGVGYLDA